MEEDWKLANNKEGKPFFSVFFSKFFFVFYLFVCFTQSNLCSAHLTALNYILRKNCEETVMCSKILTENTNVDKQLLNFTGIRSLYAKAVSIQF